MPQHALMTKESTVLSLAANVNATLARVSNTKQATIQSQYTVLQDAYRTCAVHHSSQHDVRAADWSTITAGRQTAAIVGPPLLTPSRGDFRSGAPPYLAVPPRHKVA